MSQELISVIVPVYNIEAYVEKGIKSILAQTYDNLEIIIINDGATDNSGNICHSLALIDSRIHIIDQENAGLSAARNTGLRIARGAYIAFVDGDDNIDERMYEKLYNRLIQDKSDLALCNIRYVDENGNHLDKNRHDLKNEILCEEAFWKGYYGKFQIPYVVSWNKLYRREIFKDIEFDMGRIHEDEFILHKIISQCKRISVIGDPLYNYVQRAGSIMGASYNVQRLQAIEAFNLRLNYFSQRELNFISPTMLRIIGELLNAKENLDFSVAINREEYNKSISCYKKNFVRYFNHLNMNVKIRSLIFLYCNPVYVMLRKAKRKLTT